MAERQIFVVGTGRSGTTILRKILGNHSRVHTFSNELRFITDPNGLISLAQTLTQDWNPFSASEAIAEFRHLMLRYLWTQHVHHYALSIVYMLAFNGAARKYRFINLREDIPYNHCESTLDAFIDKVTLGNTSGYWYGSRSYQTDPTLYVTREMDMDALYPIMGRFVDDLLSYPLNRTEKTCWCDDTPMNILNGHHITRMLDGARLIHIYRDPRDVVTSYVDSGPAGPSHKPTLYGDPREVVASYVDPGQAWAPDDPILAAQWVAGIMNKWWNTRKYIAPSRFIEISYEDMIYNQKDYMKDIANFIGIDFEESLLDIDLLDSSIGRHKRDLSTKKYLMLSKLYSLFLMSMTINIYHFR